MSKFLRRSLAFLFTFALLISLALPVYAGIKPNYTAYDYSEAYRSSVYYEKLIEAKSKLTGDHRYDVIMIALTQLGYHEGDCDEDMDGWNLAGTGNYVEYNRLFCKLDGIWGYAWCAAFVSWCQFQAGVPAEIDCSEVSCPRMINEVLKPQGLYKDAKSYTPLIGDLVFFKSSSSNAVSSHVGLVIGIKDGYIYTIEGNAGQKVGRHKYAVGDSYIVGYGALKYETKEGTDYSVFELTNSDMANGKYKVTADSLNVRSGIGTAYPVIGTLKKGDVVEVTEATDGWARIDLNGQVGWVSEAYLVDASYNINTVYYKVGAAEFAYSQQRKRPGEEYTIPADVPVYEGYSFLGWAVEANGAVTYNPGDKYNEDADLTLYPIWEKNIYTVTFTDHDGTLLGTLELPHGSKITVPEDIKPSRETDGEFKYEFKKWSISDPSNAYYLKADTTYTAVYDAVELTDEEKAAYESANATEAPTPPPTDAPTDAPTAPPSKTDPPKTGGCASNGVLALAAILPFMFLFKKKRH